MLERFKLFTELHTRTRVHFGVYLVSETLPEQIFCYFSVWRKWSAPENRRKKSLTVSTWADPRGYSVAFIQRRKDPIPFLLINVEPYWIYFPRNTHQRELAIGVQFSTIYFFYSSSIDSFRLRLLLSLPSNATVEIIIDFSVRSM